MMDQTKQIKVVSIIIIYMILIGHLKLSRPLTQMPTPHMMIVDRCVMEVLLMLFIFA